MPQASQSRLEYPDELRPGDRALNLNRLRLWVAVMLLALAAGTAFARAQANGGAAHKVVIHDRAWQGFTMSIARYLDDRLTVIVMTNLDSDNSKPEKIAKDAAEIYLK